MEFLEHLKSYLSDEEINRLNESLSIPSTRAVLLNLRKMDDAKFLSLFPDVIPHPIVKHAYIYNKNKYDLGKSVYHELGCFYIQEPSAMVPSFLLSPNKGETILDLCAAPGGKSVQASFLMENKGAIISNDLSRSRCNAILENVERLGIGNIVITNNDFSRIYHSYLNYFDRIILDAPCSGSGMFKKDDKMKEDWSYNKVIKFQEIQVSLIDMAYQMLKPGGIMCYSTCSFSKEEDEDVIGHLLENSDAVIEPIEDNPLFYVNKKEPLGVHLLPYIFPGDGQYICLIRKPGILKVSEDIPSRAKINYKHILGTYAPTHIEKYGDFLFGFDKKIKLNGLNIIRNGVKIGEQFKDFIKFDYHFSHFIDKSTTTISLNSTELEKYFLGYEISKKCPSGYVLLTYDGISVTIAKSNGNVIKNSIPKALRKSINI